MVQMTDFAIVIDVAERACTTASERNTIQADPQARIVMSAAAGASECDSSLRIWRGPVKLQAWPRPCKEVLFRLRAVRAAGCVSSLTSMNRCAAHSCTLVDSQAARDSIYRLCCWSPTVCNAGLPPSVACISSVMFV